MTAAVKTRRFRMVATGVACAAALLAGGAGAGVASASNQPAAPAVPNASATPHKTRITVHSDKHSVKAKESVRLTGSATGLKDGTRVSVQHYKNGKWTTLKTSTVKKGLYSTDVKLNEKGTWKLRVVHDGHHSGTTTVTVS